MLAQKTLDVTDTTNYGGIKYKYHVGYVTAKRRWLLEEEQTPHSAIILINLEIQTKEDIDYLQDKLAAANKIKPRQLLILGYNRLAD